MTISRSFLGGVSGVSPVVCGLCCVVLGLSLAVFVCRVAVAAGRRGVGSCRGRATVDVTGGRLVLSCCGVWGWGSRSLSSA